VLSNQWTNFSVPIECGTDWLSTDIFNTQEVMHQSAGVLLVYSKGTANGVTPDSPGYLLVDYSIEFDHLMINPRVLTVPTSLMKWYQIGLGTGVISPAIGDRLVLTVNTNNTPDSNVHALPTGDSIGCVYQVVLDISSSANPNAINLATRFGAKLDDGGGSVNFALTDGTTLYGVSGPLPFLDLYPTYTAAMSGRPLIWQGAGVNVSLSLACSISLVGSVSAVFSQANIG
jgi:hypothetical protein